MTDERERTPADEGAAETGAARSPEEVVADLQAAVVRHKEEADRNWQQFLHAAADLENYKKQAARQRDDAVQQARRSLLAVILTVVDNLERALEHSAAGDGETIIAGIRLAHRQVVGLLAGMGVTPMTAVGAPFDPRYHEAVDVAAPGQHSVSPGTVVEEMQRGYLLNGEVLRPARVRVAK